MSGFGERTELVGLRPAGGRSRQPEPIQGDGDLEQPVLPRAALYVPGNPSLLAASTHHQRERSPPGSVAAAVAAEANVAAAEDADMYYSASLGEAPASHGGEAAPASAPPERQPSIKDRIAALELQGSESQELQPAAPAADPHGSGLRQVRRSTSMPNGAGREAQSHAGRIESLFSYRGKLSASLLPDIDRTKLQQDAIQGELHGPSPQLSGVEPLVPDGLPGCPRKPGASLLPGMGAEALEEAALPSHPAQPSASLPASTGRELIRHGVPATLLPVTSMEALHADAMCVIDLWADKSAPAGIPKPAASKFKDGAVGTETFPDCMYVGTFKNGMRDGLGAVFPCSRTLTLLVSLFSVMPATSTSRGRAHMTETAQMHHASGQLLKKPRVPKACVCML